MNIDFRVSGDRLEARNKKAQIILDTVIVQDTDDYVPFQEGPLSGSVRPSIGTGMLTYIGPQGHFLYVGKVMVSPTTGNPRAKKNEKKVYTDRPLTYYKAHPLAGPDWFGRSKKDNSKKWINTVKEVYRGG